MKKYSVYLILFISFLGLFLSSCDNKNDKEDDYVVDVGEEGIIIPDDLSFYLYLGEEYNPFHSQNSDYSFKIETDSVATIDSSGKIRANSVGYTTLFLYKKQKNIKVYSVCVMKKENVNYNYDETLFNELKQKTDISNSNYYIISTYKCADSINGVKPKSLTSTIMLKKEPFYVETKTSTSGSLIHSIVKEASNNKYINYDIDDEARTYTSSYLSSSEFNASKFISNNLDFFSEIDNIDKSKIELNYNDHEGYYTLKTTLSNFTSLYDTVLKDLVGDYYDKIKDTVVIMSFSFNAGVYIDFCGTLHFKQNGQLIHSNFGYKININPNAYFSTFEFVGYKDLNDNN